MDYSFLKSDEKATGVKNRIFELEGEHFSNTVYAQEAEWIGDTQSIDELRKKNEYLEVRIEGLKKLLASYVSPQESEDK